MVWREPKKIHTGSNLRSTREAASTDLEKSGSPHLSTTFGISPSFPRASITVQCRKKKQIWKKIERKTVVYVTLLPLTRPSTSNVRARSGGQPGQSTFVVRGIFCTPVERKRLRLDVSLYLQELITDKPYQRHPRTTGEQRFGFFRFLQNRKSNRYFSVFHICGSTRSDLYSTDDLTKPMGSASF